MTPNAPSLDELFAEAVAAIDAGNLAALEKLLATHPNVAQQPLTTPGSWLCGKFGGKLPDFFRDPYLLWFVTEDPIRHGSLPDNIVALTEAILRYARQGDPVRFQRQIDCALRLTSWSTVARKCGVQIGLIDVLVDAGAALDGNPSNALVNGNLAAAEHLLHRGAAPTLETALCLERWHELPGLAATATPSQKQFALVMSALNGKAEALRRLLPFGVDVNAPSADLYAHGTPLHHAVCSGNLACVRVLVEAGANTGAKDTAWQGTPLGWAEYGAEGKPPGEERNRYLEIATYLRERVSATPPVHEP